MFVGMKAQKMEENLVEWYESNLVDVKDVMWDS